MYRLELKKFCGFVCMVVCGGGGGEKCNENNIGEMKRLFMVYLLEYKRLSCIFWEVFWYNNEDKLEYDVFISVILYIFRLVY